MAAACDTFESQLLPSDAAPADMPGRAVEATGMNEAPGAAALWGGEAADRSFFSLSSSLCETLSK